MRNSLPVGYPTGSCILLAIDRGLAPIIAGVVSQLLEERLWTADSYQNGYYAVTEVLSQMTNNCLSNLVQEIRDFRGVLPDFEATPIDERTSDMYNSLNTSFAKLLELRGVMDDGWFTDTFTTLKDVVQVNRGVDQTNAVDMWGTVSDLLITGASVGDIATNVAGMLSDVAETAVEGGLLTAIVAIEASNAAMLQQISNLNAATYTTLNLILAALRGESPITDNILQALRGDTPADATRNIVEQLL